MAYIITVATSVVSAMLVFVLQYFIRENIRLKHENEEKREQRETALEEGVVCLLRKELIADHEKWVANGYITSTALENGLLMYDAYKKLGGNGMIDHMKDEIEKLHIQ